MRIQRPTLRNAILPVIAVVATLAAAAPSQGQDPTSVFRLIDRRLEVMQEGGGV